MISEKGEGVQMTVIDNDDDDVRRTVDIEPHTHLDDDVDCRLWYYPIQHPPTDIKCTVMSKK